MYDNNMTEIKDRVLSLCTAGFADFVFQVCRKVTISLYLFDLV